MNHRLRVENMLAAGDMAAAEMPSSNEDRYAWIGVYPLDISKQETQRLLRTKGFDVSNVREPVYFVRLFEVSRPLIDEDRWISEPDLQNGRDALVTGKDNLFLLLKNENVELSKLGLPSNSNYPI